MDRNTGTWVLAARLYAAHCQVHPIRAWFLEDADPGTQERWENVAREAIRAMADWQFERRDAPAPAPAPVTYPPPFQPAVAPADLRLLRVAIQNLRDDLVGGRGPGRGPDYRPGQWTEGTAIRLDNVLIALSRMLASNGY
jgi:hypothetical protein